LSLLSGDALAKMRDRARALAQPQAAQRIAEELRQIGTRDWKRD
jgi:UDP-N-acetylglucosamine:LPS N-acetylglucosamine transferase